MTLSRAWLVARLSLVRQIRSAREHPWLAFVQVFSVLFGVVLAVGRVPVAGFDAVWAQPGGYVLGQRAAAGDPSVLADLRGFAGLLFVLLVFLSVLKETTEGAMETHVDELLLAAGVRAVAVGGVLWSVAFTALQFGPLVVAGAVAFGVGSGSPASAVLLFVAGAALVTAAVAVGFLLAVCVKLLFRRVEFVREHSTAVGAPLAVAYFAVFVNLRSTLSLLSALPFGWYADAGLIAVAPWADPARGAVALAATPVLAVGATVLTVPVAERVWTSDPPADETTDHGGWPRAEAVLSRVAPRPTAAVARSVWIRLRREPRVLLFTLLPVVVTAGVGVELAAVRPPLLPAVVAVYGSAAVGMGATLNPLGSAGAGLPVALTAPRGGRHLVHGYALSAVLPGAPIVAAATAVAAAAIGLSPALVVAAAAVGAGLAACGTFVSMAVGVALPNLDGLRPAGGSGIRPPRLWATTVFLAVMALLGTPALVGMGFAREVGEAAALPPLTVALGGLALSLSLALAAGVVAYRRALSAIVAYTVE